MFSASKTAGPSGYAIQRSVRLRASASAFFSRTESAAATSNQKLTFSAWVKRGSLTGNLGSIYQAGVDASCDIIRFTNTDTLQVWFNAATSVTLVTSAVFRDPSAWYHIVVAIDTTQATSTNRIIIYVNGVIQTLTGTQPSLNATFAQFNQNTIINRFGYYNSTYFDGYIAEAYMIDGQALAPSSFGEIDSTTGVWKPKAYSGSYGTNGFFLKFADNSGSTATTIGKDSSGNGNNWTPNNISVTAGVTYDSMLDVPTPYSDGGTNRGNYCVLNPVNPSGSAASNGNLRSTAQQAFGSIQVFSGKWYFEAIPTTSTVVDSNTYYTGVAGNVFFAYALNGNKYVSGWTAFGASYTTGDVIGVAFDVDAGTASFYKNGTLQGTQTGSPGWMYPYGNISTSNTNSLFDYNFGQRPFTYTPPTGYIALNTFNLPAPTIKNGAKQFAATTYTGTGATLTVANTVNSVNFQPDFVWVKGRSGATSHDLYDSVRGTTKQLIITTAAETTEATGLTAFGSTGFTVGALASLNTNAATYVAWQWKASNTTAVTNTAGSITSSVSANPTAGFSILTYTGTSAAGTIGHGLGIAPKMIIVKPRTATVTTDSWNVYHSSIGNTQFLVLDSTAAAVTASNRWNNTSPTSSVFSIGTAPSNNGVSYVAYCFAEIAGFSKFGSYTGNASADGPFVYTGFRPRYVCIKESSAARGWIILDTSRDTYNVAQNYLFAETSAAEGATTLIDILSNGFKVRSTNLNVNDTTSSTFIFFAFAENPFNYSLAR